MSLFILIQQCLESTERAEKTIKNISVLKYEWENKEKKEIVYLWMKDIFSLLKKDPMKIGQIEPLLFVLADKIVLQNKSFLFKFLKDLNKYHTHLLLESWRASKEEEKKVMIEAIITAIIEWEKLSQSFFEDARRNLQLIEDRSNGKSLNFMIREFHPRKIDAKHPWNEIQLTSLRELSTEEILAKASEDPLSGFRFFITDDIRIYGPATGIEIKSGHHRVYELYRRYINGLLEKTCFHQQCNGNILVLFLEKH
ncbi:MAG: hypothetical protein Q8R18_06595 [bacterium]|nr:hypothetical protein [bacterium]